MVQFNLDVPSAQYVGTEREASKLLQRLMNKVERKPEDFIGYDTETHAKKIPIHTKVDGSVSKVNPLDWMQDTVTFWSMSAKLENYERWALPVQLLHYFIPLLENKKARLATWNGKYDAHVSYNSGIYVFGSTYIDGLAMAALVDENLQGDLGLKDVAPKENPFFHPRRKMDRNTYWEEPLKAGLIEDWVPIPMTKFVDLFPKKDPTGKKIVEYEYSIIDLFKHYPDRVSDYASLDAYATLRMVEHLQKIMSVIPLTDEGYEAGSMWDYFMEMEIFITEILWRMERRGLGIDVEYLEKILGPMSEELKAVEKEIWGQAGWPVNINSTADLTQLFFGPADGTVKRGKEQVLAPGLGLEPVKMTKGGKTKLPSPSTDGEVLDELAGMGVEVAQLIKRHRTLHKMKGTYVEAMIRLCKHHKDGRLHPEFKQFGARTGRFSTKNPNSQNMPRPDGDEFQIRSAFVANRRLRKALQSKTGQAKLRRKLKLIVGDYEQLEMRIMAHFSQDPGMLEAIRNGLDLHCVTVEKMYGIPYQDAAKAKKLGIDRAKIPLTDEVLQDLVALGKKGPSNLAVLAQQVLNGEIELSVLDEEIHDYVRKRQECKTIGFGIIYGAGGKTIGLQLEIPSEEAEEKIELYFQAFPGVRDYMDYTVAECSEDEYVTTLVGRRRRLADINHHQFMKRSHAEREAVNARIQGTAADIVKAAMINIEFDPELQRLGVKIINQIHDELVMECPEETVHLAIPRIKLLMEMAFNGEAPLCVPTPCDIKEVESWDKAK